MTRAAVLIIAAALTTHRADVGVVSLTPVLKVCADPDNLPFSNQQEQGFENRVADVIARDIGARVAYTWFPQRRGFLRKTLNAGACDVVIGFPTTAEMVSATRPYYRSSYVFVSRVDRNLDITSFDDERLGALRIGVQLIGDDGANAPPAHALSRRGLVRNIVGFPVYDKPIRIIAAVESGEIDLAAVWGPLAGYYAAQSRSPLHLAPVSSQFDSAFLPLAFDISIAVRAEDIERRDALNTIIDRRRRDIDAILAEYHVPRVAPPEVR